MSVMIKFETDRLTVLSDQTVENGILKRSKTNKTIDLLALKKGSFRENAFRFFKKNCSEEIGAIDIYVKEPDTRYQLNYCIHEEHNKNCGYMSEALLGLITFLQNNTKIESIIAIVAPTNDNSKATLKKCKFIQEDNQLVKGGLTYVYLFDRKQ